MDVDEGAGEECPPPPPLLEPPFRAFLFCRGDEWGLCFSVRDNVLLSACRDEVAMLKSPRSCKGKENGVRPGGVVVTGALDGVLGAERLRTMRRVRAGQPLVGKCIWGGRQLNCLLGIHLVH